MGWTKVYVEAMMETLTCFNGNITIDSRQPEDFILAIIPTL